MSEKKFNSVNSDYGIPTINYKEFVASQMTYSNVIEVETIDLLNKLVPSNTENYEEKTSNKNEDFDYRTYMNSNAPFKDQTQYQEITFETSHFSMWYTSEKNENKYEYKVIDGIKHYEVNKTVSELCESMPLGKLSKDYNISDNVIEIIKERSGNGKTKIVEIFSSESGMEAVLCQDVEGNYRLDYSMTNVNKAGDFIFDGVTGISGNLDIANNSNSGQKTAAQKVARYAYNKVLEEQKKNPNCSLSFKGYSLGGATCEYGYLEVCDIPGSEDVLGTITLYNPLHGGLTDDEVKKIKSAKKLNLYVNEYDFVHTINNFDDFKDKQVTIKGYEPVFEKNAQAAQKNPISLADNDYHTLENLRIESYIKAGFNKDGSIKEKEGKVYNCTELMNKYYDLSNVEDKNLITYLYALLTSYVSKIIDGTGNEFVDDSISTLFTPLTPPIDILVSSIAMLYGQTSFGDTVTGSVATISNIPIRTLTNAASVILDIPSLLSFVPEGYSPITDAYNNFAKQSQNIGNQIQDFGCDVAENVQSSINSGYEQMSNFVSGVWSWCCNLF